MKTSRHALSVFLASLVLFFHAAGSKASSAQEDQVFLDQWREQQQVTSAVMSVQDTETGQLTTERSGLAKLPGKKPVTPETIFGVGSITKTFVAAAILQLQEEGKLKLDDAIGSYFPEYPRWRSITIRQLLNMTSGISNFTSLPDFQTLQKSHAQKMILPEQIIAIAYAAPDKFSPGTGWHYSNTNYYLIGLLLEKISKQPLAVILSRRFFQPLHLTHTFYSNAFYPPTITELMARAYDGTQDVTLSNFSLYGAAGGMLMNASDLRAWAAALLTPGIILKQASIDEMEKTVVIPPSSPKPLGARYGLGIYSLDMPKIGTIWYYAGVIDSYTSCFVFIPSQHKLIVAQAAVPMCVLEKNIGLLFPGQELIERLMKN